MSNPSAHMPNDDAQSAKKRKLEEEPPRDSAADAAAVSAIVDASISASAGASSPPPPTPSISTTTVDTNANATMSSSAASSDSTVLVAEKKRVLQLLAPFSRDQLVEILTSAAMQHADVWNEINTMASADVAHRKVFVRGLAWETTSESLQAAFAVFGAVSEGAVIFDKATAKSRGYGFVTFVSMDSARRAVAQQTMEIDGRTATCNLAAVRANTEDQPKHASSQAHHGQQQQTPQHHHPHGAAGGAMMAPSMAPVAAASPYAMYGAAPMQQAPVMYGAAPMAPTGAGANDEASRKLFVRGLSWDTTDDSLRAEFQRHGELAEAAVVRDRKTGKSKGFGFVTYRQRSGADSALQQPQKFIDGRNVTCNLASLGRNSAPTNPYQAAAPPMGGVPSMGYGGYAAPPMQQQPPVGYGMYAPVPMSDPQQQQQPPAYPYYAPPPAASGAHRS